MNIPPMERRRLSNRVQSAILITALAGYLGVLGWILWGGEGIGWLLAAGAVALMFNPSASPRLLLSLYRAEPIPRAAAPALHRALEALAARAGLPAAPQPWYVPSPMLNAFTVGSAREPAIALTDGLLSGMSFRELVGVLAHEVSHIQAKDIRVMALADLFTRLTHLLSTFGQVLLVLNLPMLYLSGYSVSWWVVGMLVLAPGLSLLTQLALSRSREYEADRNAARLTGDPRGLASALVKLERVQAAWFEQLFLPGRRNPQPSLLRTHPATEDRVARLLELESEAMAEPDGWIQTGDEPAWARGSGRAVSPRARWRPSGLWY